MEYWQKNLYSLWFAQFVVMAGPLIGGALAAFPGLRSIFLINTGILFVVLLWQRTVTDRNKRRE